jgi:hypothetical protein
MLITRIYADDHGDSHFDAMEIEFTPPSPLRSSSTIPAAGFEFLTAPVGFASPPHAAPSRQFVIPLLGALRVEASDGESREFAPGSVLLLKDTTGAGHRTIVTSTEELCVGIVLAPAASSHNSTTMRS